MKVPPFFLPVMVYFDIYVLATIFSLSPVLSIFGIHDRSMGLINLTNLVLLYFLIFNIVTTRGRQTACLTVTVVSAVLVSMVGILEYSGINPLPFFPDLKGHRVGSTLGNADYATPVIILALPLAVAFLFRRWKEDRRRCCATAFFRSHRLTTPLYVVAVVLLAMMLLLSLPTPGLTWDLPKTNLPDKPSPGNLSLTEAAGALPGVAAGRLEVRRGLWEAGIKATLAYPVLGSGPNTYRDVFTRYEPLYYVRQLPNYHEDKAHNEFIEVAQSTGFPSLAAYLWMLAAILWFFWGWIKRNRKDPDAALVAAVLVGTAGYSAYTFMVFHTIAAYTWYWLLLGLGAGLCRSSVSPSAPGLSGRGSSMSARSPVSDYSPGARAKTAAVLGFAVTALAWLAFTALRPVFADVSAARASQVPVRDLDSQREAASWRRSAAGWHPYEYRYLSSAARAVTDLGIATRTAPITGAEFQEATGYIDRALRQEPWKASGYFARAMIYFRSGRSPDEVLKEVDKAIELYPYYAAAYNLAADIEASRRDWDRAVALRRKALDILPDDTYMMVQVGHDSLQARRFSEAIAVLEQAISTGNKTARAWFLLGGAYELSGYRHHARQAYEAALLIEPGNIRARIALDLLSGT